LRKLERINICTYGDLYFFSDDAFTTYSYDHGGRLTKVNLPNNDEIRYTSDALNRRIAKMKNGNYEYILLYSGQLSPIARLDADSRVVEEYVYGSRVNVPEYMIKDGRKYRFSTDHRGSVRLVVDTQQKKHPPLPEGIKQLTFSA